MKHILSFVILSLIVGTLPLSAQRNMEKLDRGVVAVRNTSGSYFVSWRFFATDPDDVTFNLYVKSPVGSSFTRLNNLPLHVTNFQANAGSISIGSQLYVTAIKKGIESEPSGIFTVTSHGFTTMRSAYLDIAFNPANDGLELTQYNTKFVWPADLDGDGEYDFVVDRLSTTGKSHKVQAYLRDGTLLWTIDMGPNVTISQGQDDMVIAYDMDQDGKAEVVVKSSDGTQFSDGKGVFGSTSLDTDNDGIINYNTQNVRNSPQYITVIDGMTGREKNSIEMNYPSIYNRTNKSTFMGDEYNNLNGHMTIFYADGKRPAVGFIYKVRTVQNQAHYYFGSAWGYNSANQWVNIFNWERGSQSAAEAHGIRAADVDGDGKDELLNIGFGLKGDGTLAFSANLSHGDRFRVGDIDPERPGLETFAVQQNAPSLLGMVVYDAATGEHLKRFYLPAVGDVGRGECIDIDSTRLGYEFWSTMPNIYDSKGNVLHEGGSPWPYEGVWWDGALDREQLAAADGNGFNADIRKYDHSSKTIGNRLIEFAKMTNWQVNAAYGVRPAFFGDIAGDWREEIILKKRNTVVVDGNNVEAVLGFVGFSTDYPTSHRIYCLMQNPAYRMQATTKGYYQSAFPDFYLGYQMPTPPIAPVQEAKLHWKSGISLETGVFTTGNNNTGSYTSGDDIMFDLSGDNSAAIQLSGTVVPSKIWAMNPKGHDYILGGSGKLSGTMEFVKSMQGTFILNGQHNYTGLTRVSEGNLQVNGSLEGPVQVDANGTLSGNVVLNGAVTLKPSLHAEGGRLAPGKGLSTLGKITVNNHLVLPGKTNLHFDIVTSNSYRNDSLVVNGDLTAIGLTSVVVTTPDGGLEPGTYSLLKWSGTFTGSASNFVLKGISGLPAVLTVADNTLQLVVSSSRSAGSVVWTGQANGTWDFLTNNFSIGSTPTAFVSGDEVEFNDQASVKTITLTDQFAVTKTTFNTSSSYILKGSGGISGEGNLEKTGYGLLDIQTVNNTYTGKTILNNARVQVASLSDAGAPGSLGAGSSAPDAIQLTNSRLIVNAIGTNTNRGIRLSGVDTISVPRSNGVLSLSGVISGTGQLVLAGDGQINLSASAANTHSGGTVIDKARVALGSILMNNSGMNAITFKNGGRLTMFYSTGYGQAPNWKIDIPAAHSGTLVASGRCNIEGTLSGEGTLNFVTPYVRADWVANSVNFNGKLNVTSDNDGGSFRITNNATGFPNATISLGDKVDMGAYSSIGASGTNTNSVVKIGALEGVAGSSIGGGRWEIGYNNADAIFNGTTSSSATITKVGTGKWTLTGTSASTAVVNVNGGTLEVRNTTGSATGTNAVYVRDGATLAGTGIIGGSLLVQSGGTLSPGNNGFGTLTINGTLSLLTGATTRIELFGAQLDRLTIGGIASLKGTLEIVNKGSSYTAGTSYKIITANSITGMFDAINPRTPGEGLEWNTSRISEGIISVDVASSVTNPEHFAIQLYPQPASDYCMLSFDPTFEAHTVELIDATGKIIVSEPVLSAQHHRLELGALRTGIYFARVSGKSAQRTVKLVKL